MILLVEKDRHSIMDAVREIVGGGDDQRGTRNRLAGCLVYPAIPKASNRQHRTVCGTDEIGLLGFLDGVPLIIAGRGTRQRVRLKAERNIGLSAIVSARALTIKSLSWRLRLDAEKFAAPVRSMRPSIG